MTQNKKQKTKQIFRLKFSEKGKKLTRRGVGVGVCLLKLVDPIISASGPMRQV